MRISADRNDPGFKQWCIGAVPALFVVHVDGKIVDKCVVVDEEAGYVEVHCVLPDGRPDIDHEAGAVRRRRIYGHVRLVFTEAGKKMVQFDEESGRPS